MRQTLWHEAQGRGTGMGTLHFDNQKKGMIEFVQSFSIIISSAFLGVFFLLMNMPDCLRNKWSK